MNTVEVVKEIKQDIKKLKLRAFEPKKSEAEAVLDYLSWEEGETKTNFEICFEKELVIINEWLEIYCKEYNCTKEEALKEVVFK